MNGSIHSTIYSMLVIMSIMVYFKYCENLGIWFQLLSATSSSVGSTVQEQ